MAGLTGAAAGGGAGGGLFAALGAIAQAQYQAAAIQQSAYAAQAEAQAADYNAQLARQNATLARQQYGEEERRFRERGAKQIGAIRAQLGATNLSLEGSPMDVIEDTAANLELDALTIRHRGELEALGYESEAQLADFRAANARRQSSFIGSQAGAVRFGGFFNAAAGLMNSRAGELRRTGYVPDSGSTTSTFGRLGGGGGRANMRRVGDY